MARSAGPRPGGSLSDSLLPSGRSEAQGPELVQGTVASLLRSSARSSFLTPFCGSPKHMKVNSSAQARMKVTGGPGKPQTKSWESLLTSPSKA